MIFANHLYTNILLGAISYGEVINFILLHVKLTFMTQYQLVIKCQ